MDSARLAALETESVVANQWGACVGLVGFAVTVVRGLCSSVGFDATLQAALLALSVMYGLGWLSGHMWGLAFQSASR